MIPEPPLAAFSSDEPRRWVPVPAVADRHVESTHGMIQLAAQLVTPRRALVLGAEASPEVPVAALAARFEGVVLLDQDASAGPGSEPVESDSRSGSTLLRRYADLTGVTGPFLDQVDRILATADPDAAVESIAALADATNPVVFRLDSRFDLVVASGVLYKLHTEAANRTLERFTARFPAHLPRFRESPRWFQAMHGLARRMETALVDSLLDLVEPQGRIFLSECIQGCFLHRAPGDQCLTDGMYRMTRTLELSDYFDARFRVVERGRWVWLIPPGPEPGQIGRLFKVQGLILARA